MTYVQEIKQMMSSLATRQANCTGSSHLVPRCTSSAGVPLYFQKGQLLIFMLLYYNVFKHLYKRAYRY